MIETTRLSDEQRKAAQAGPEGAYLIAAGPGTGKTFTMVERFCWLVEQGVPAESVLAVTFTERAAAELRERISRELGERGRRAQAALLLVHMRAGAIGDGGMAVVDLLLRQVAMQVEGDDDRKIRP